MAVDEKEKNEIIAEAYAGAAQVFETYASDQIACKRFQSTKRAKTDCDLRAATWADAAKELRKAASAWPWAPTPTTKLESFPW